MTTESVARVRTHQTQFRLLAARCARVMPAAPPKEGAGNAGCPMHPRSRVHLVVLERTRVTTNTPESPGIPARNGFNGLYRALPGDRALLPPSPALLSANLTPASGRQDHTSSPSACRRARLQRRLASTASRPTSVTIAKRPSEWDGMANHIGLIWASEKQKYFCKRGWTGRSPALFLICPAGTSPISNAEDKR
jgi:hypothetical protein